MINVKKFFIKLFKISGVDVFYKKFIYRTSKLRKIVLINCQEYKIYVNTRDVGITPALVVEKIFEQDLTEMFKKLITSGMNVIDIGANIGYYTLIASPLIKEGGKVYAFEPNPDNYSLLLKNIAVNGYKNVAPCFKALSNECGKRKLFLDKSNFGNPSFSERNVPRKISFLEVETITLDSFIGGMEDKRIDVVKIDAQGAEGLIIQGGYETLKNNKMKIFMEFWPYGLRNMGTNPLGLLRCIRTLGFNVSIVDKNFVTNMEDNEMIGICDNAPDKKGSINLLLEK